MTTLRVVSTPTADTDVCAMPVGYGQTCDLPGDHDDGCTWPLHCPCGHGPSTHTGGYGQCWQHPCGCDRYEDHTPPRVPEHLRIDDIQDYLRQKGEIQ